MKPVPWRLTCLVACGFVVLVLLTSIATAPKNPVALIRVVDASGRPIAQAVVLPEGLRTKSGPYVSGWYGWRKGWEGVPNSPTITDKDGYTRVPYPKYVFERIETGTLCLSVHHPDFVSDRPERVVATAPPTGAPWRVRVEDLLDRIRHKALLARPDPVVLQKGAILRLSVRPDAAISKNARLFAQVRNGAAEDTNFWIRPEPNLIVTRRLSAGPHTVRAVQLDSDGSAWFSDVAPITAATGETNELLVAMKRGVMVRGQLDRTVPRPVKNGRVVAQVWPPAANPKDGPPEWHAWAAVSENGSFAITSLPEGNLEIVALCEGFVSTNPPGYFDCCHPQKHLLGTNDLVITIGMEPTARLEVEVTDERGLPLKDVSVETWPNIYYGECCSTVLMRDCYNLSEWLLTEPGRTFSWGKPVLDFQGVSDGAGLAVLPNLPAEVKVLAVEHPDYTLPAVGITASGKRREASFKLIAGQTNRVRVQLEPIERSPITHY